MEFTVKNLSFGYNKKNTIENINFDLKDGEILTILGPNGVGKTTLLKCVLTFLEYQGEVLIDNVSIKEIEQKKLWEMVSYVPQAREVNVSYLVEEMILMGRGIGLSLFQMPTEHDYKVVDDIMKELQIEFLKGKYCNQISGGELQMVLVARALVSTPKILILDEPETNLDSFNQMKVLEAISKCAQEGIICIFNTHYPTHALQISDKSLMISYDNSYVYGESKVIINEINLEKTFNVKSKILTTEEDGHTYYSIINIERNNKI
ncbi:MAG: ABC transporter ATP-binding protein [bacterium]